MERAVVSGWRNALLERLLLIIVPAFAIDNIVTWFTSRAVDRPFILVDMAVTVWAAFALVRRSWPFWMRGAAMLSPIVAYVVIVYMRVGIKGNASALGAVAVVLTGLLFGRRHMLGLIVLFTLLAIGVGTAMSLDVMPWQPLRLAEVDNPTIWTRATTTAVILWLIAGWAVTFVVDRIERSLAETREALVALEIEQRHVAEAELARQRTMEALVQAQKCELVSQLAASVAHDVNNVLGVISLWSGLPRDHDTEEMRERGRRALDEALKQGKGLMRQLMAVSRTQPRQTTRFPLDRVVTATVETLKAAIPRKCVLRLDVRSAPQIEADETEIQQILYNLVLNARDAMPDGGQIVVTVDLESSTSAIEVVDGSLAPGDWATIAVTDTGPGIDAAVRDRIFDLFFTTKQERGTGLGLATVLRIAKVSGGGVMLETEPGRGTTFKIYLPST